MSYASETKSSELNGELGEVHEKVCPTRFLEDAPAEDDLLAFHGEKGPHERVAQAISEVIQSPDELGGKMIGLEGGWGAGKTTVINLVRKHLDGNDDITLFSFDAWAHEGDPLRRTFLESLIKHFQTFKWIDKTDWDKTLDKLANRRRVTTTRTVPKTTTLGKLFAISAFLVPLGIPFLQSSLKQGVVIDSALPINWMFAVGTLFTAAPFIVLLWNVIRCIKTGVSDWAFLTGDAITETKQDTTETPEPTSIEFEDNFCRLMDKALPENSKRQAVIVLDNLDRVDPKDALAIWATLQTFLQDRRTRMEQWFEKLWILVPYDPTGLRQLWENRHTADMVENENNAFQDNDYKDTDEGVSESFIDKSFQLRFEVAPPVLSNWKAYLEELVKKALPEGHEDDQHTIYRVFYMSRDKDSEAPTPRELKLYVNQIGAIHRQWQHQFPIGHIAYYVTLQRKHVNIRKGLLNGELLNPNMASILPPNLQANLAGLAFNVRARLGQQLLLGNSIYGALEKNDTEMLEQIEKRHKDGCWVVLEDVATQRLPGADALTVANSALCMDKSGILKDQKRNEVTTIKQGLRRAASRVTSWSPFCEDLANGIATICRIISDPTVSKQVVSTLRQTLLELQKVKERPPITEEIIRGVVNVYEELDSLSHQDALDRPFTLPGDASDWVEVCSIIRKQKDTSWKLFRPQEECEEVSEFLSATVKNGRFSDRDLMALQVTQASLDNCNWDSLAEAFDEQLRASQNTKSHEANYLLSGLSLLKRYGCTDAEDVMKRLAKLGHLMHGLHEAQSEKNIESKARFIVMFLEYMPEAEAPQPPAVGNSEPGYRILTKSLNADDTALATQMVKILHDQGNTALLFTVVDNREEYDPLIIRCLRIMAKSETPEVLYTPETVIERWADLWNHLNEDDDDDTFEKLIGSLCANSSLAEEVQKAEGGFNHEDAWLYSVISQADSSVSFREWCRAGLEKLDSSQWKSELDDEEGALELLLNLIDTGMTVALKYHYLDALVSHAEGLLTGKKVSDDLLSRRSQVLAGLGTGAERIPLAGRLLDAAMDRNGKCEDGFFHMYGEEIADIQALTQDNRIVSRLFSPLVRERKIGGLRWLEEVLSKNKDLMDKYSDKASVKEFRDRLQGELGMPADDDDDAHRLIAEIADILGIKPEEKASKDEASNGTDRTEEESSEGENSEEE